MRNLDTLLTSEMTPAEWKRFRKEWIEDVASMDALELEIPKARAKERAEILFEQYVGQEGYTARDESISHAREMKRSAQ